MANVGYATLQIIPSVRGIGDELRRQLVGPAGDAGGDAGDAAGEGFSGKLKAGLAGAAVAAGAVLVKGLNDAIGQANVTSTLQAQLGTSNKVAAQQGKLAGKLFSSGVTDSFEGAAEAIKSVVQSGLAPPDATNAQLQSIATKASDVANVFGQDLGGVTNAVSQLMRTGLVKNSSEAFDLLTKGFQSGADKAGDLLDTVNEYGTQFRKAGLTGADAIGLINQAIAGGARDADLAADAIKEFSIRAVDGSATTKAGFKALGLSADGMAEKFGKGGKSSKAVLDLVLDRLRGIKDPVKQAAAATNLFGTQAEDLGKALFAMDPSKAAAGLGKLGGSASKLGKTIRSGPSYELQTFKRTLEQGLVNFIGGRVLPVLTTLAVAFNATLLPPIRAVATVVAAVLVPTLVALFKAGMATVSWLREWGVWLAPIAVLIGGVTLALSAQAIATAAVTAVFSVYRAAILIGTAVTEGFTIAQATLNAVMSLNPIALVVIALVALGLALFIAWKKSETFRAVVMAAWQGIQTAALFAWNSVLKPTLAAIVVALSAVGRAASWLWHTVLQPVFSGIATAGKIMATIVAVLVIGPMILAFRLLSPVVLALWHAAFQPAFHGIAALAVWLYGAVIKPQLTAVRTIIHAVGTAATWLWKNAFAPAMRGIGALATWLYNNAIRPQFAAARVALNLLGAAARVMRAVITTALRGVGAVAVWLYQHALKPQLDAGKRAVGLFAGAFRTAKDAIATQWSKLSGIAKRPISFIVNTVYNRGIVGVWNKIAGAFGAPKLGKYAFADGGFTGPGGKYTPAGIVHAGEFVTSKASTTRLEREHPGVLSFMNQTGRLPGYALGGLVGGSWDWVKSAASKGFDLAKSGVPWLKDGIKASALAGMKKLVDPLIAKISGSASLYKDMVTKIPKRMLSAIFDFGGKADKRLGAAGVGGKGTRAALRWARTQNGKRYQWGGNGNPSWDCSGFMSAIESVIRGQRPHRRWATGAFSGRHAPPGWELGRKAPFMIGITNAGVGHTAGTLNGVNVESRGGDGVIVGPRARGYNSSLFGSRYGFAPSRKFDAGGWLMPGATVAHNLTGRPEAVLTSQQFRVLAGAARAGVAGGDRVLHYHATVREEASEQSVLRALRHYDLLYRPAI